MTAIIISILSAIVSGMVLYFLKRFFDKREREQAERDKQTARENILILKCIDAVGKLTYADAIAIRDGRTNGEMAAAIKAYKKADEELYEFLLEQNAHRQGGN